MRSATTQNPIQGFAPREIRTGVTTLDTEGVVAIRISSDATYYINTDSGNTATMPAGVTVVDHGITQLVFSSAQTVEVMKG